MLEVTDTIAAIAVPLTGGARGIVRVSGPRAMEIVQRNFTSANEKPLRELRGARVVSGSVTTTLADHEDCSIPCDAFVWPGSASYTRQQMVELHTLGSPPILQAMLRTLCDAGARLAEPGEFTLRAFLAGRLDLTQAEAVLGVIDARGAESLQTALQQLAGGLSQPLARLRTSLIDLLADLEAGLDFVEEDIEFVTRDEVLRRVDAAAAEVEELIARLAHRGMAGTVPRVVLVGPPNSGKSSLFNALWERFGSEASAPALVSEVAGTTRDYLAANLKLGGVECLLVDTAGVEDMTEVGSISATAEQMTQAQRQNADLRLRCFEAVSFDGENDKGDGSELTILTKCDLLSQPPTIGCVTSALTGAGFDALAAEIRKRLGELTTETNSGMVAATSARCEESLHSARDGLIRLRELMQQLAGEELLAAELREVLTNLGRVVGAIYTDDILDQIFARFCIGK